MRLVTINGTFANGAPFYTALEESDFSNERLDMIIAGSTSDGASIDAESIVVGTIEIEG